MPFAAGPTGAASTVTVLITGEVVNEGEISREIYLAFTKALGDVLKSKKFEQGMRVMIRRIGKEMEKALAKSGDRIADQLTKAFNKVPPAAASAAGKARSSLGHMVPPNIADAINRLITQFDRLAAAVKTATKPDLGLERVLERLNRQATVATTEASRQQTAAVNSALQNQAALTNASAKKRVAIIQAMSQQIRALERGIGAAIKFGLEVAGKAVNALGAALRGIGRSAQAGTRAAVAALRGITTAMQNIIRGVARLSAGLATGFARGFARVSSALRAALSRDESALRSSLARRERAVGASAQRQSSLLSRLTTPGGLAALAGGAGIGGLLTAGFERAGAEERLQLTFETLLGGDAQRAQQVLQDLSDYARTTAFDFTEVAGSAAQVLAVMGDPEEATNFVKWLSDITALTGGGTEQFGRARLAFTQLLSSGRLEVQELNQLVEALPGIPFSRILADKFFGGDLEAFNAARRAGELGEISATEFMDALNEGLAKEFPELEGTAVRLAGTLSGMAANLKENFAIFGAEFIRLVEGPIKSTIGFLNDAMLQIGGFISGDMFKAGGGQENPFEAMAPDARVMFEDLPEEFQRSLADLHGFGPENWVSAADAAQWWRDNMTPPAEVNETMERLQQLRDMLGDFAKGAGGFLAVAAGIKVLGLALRFLISPLTIITGLFGLLGVFWGRLTRASPKLNSSVKLVRQQFGNLLGTFKETVGVVGGLISNVLFGDSDFFKNLGDRVADFTNTVGRLVGELNNWLKWANEMIAAGNVGAVIDSISQNVQGFVASLLGLTDAQQEAAQAAGGNDFVNIFTAFLDKLEQVPILGPIVAFARRIVDTLTNALGGVGGFIGDIWGILFGEDEATAGENQLEAISTSLFGTESQQQSTGSRILDRLEDTFLGPIVGFFRGPFADAAETAIGGVVGFIQDVVGWIDSGGLGRAWATVRDFFAPIFNTIAETVVSAWDRIQPIVQPLIDKVTELVDAFKNMDFSEIDIGGLLRNVLLGGAAGLIIAGPIGAVIGGIAGALFDPLVEAIGNAWTMEIEPALEGLWENLKGWFDRTFTAANMTSTGQKVLNAIRTIGFWIGKVVSDPVFVIALAILAAGLVTALGAAIVGAIQGVIDNADEWGTLLMSGLTVAFDFIKTEGPGALKDAITAIFTSPEVGIAIALGGLLLGTKIGRGFIGGIGSFFKNRTQTGKMQTAMTNALKNANLGTALGKTAAASVKPSAFATFFDRISTSLTSGLRKARTKIASVGKALGGALLSGLISFEAGQLGGRSGSTGGLIMGLLTGAGVGFATGGPKGAVIGAALAGIGAAIGASGAAADEAAVELGEYTDALRGLTDLTDIKVAGAEVVIDNLSDTLSKLSSEDQPGKLPATLTFLSEGQFDAQGFVDDVKTGSFQIEQAMGDLFQALGRGESTLIPEEWDHDLIALGGAIKELGTGFGTFDDLKEALKGLGETGDLAPGQLERMLELLDLLEDKGVDFDAVIDALFDERGELSDALAIEDFRADLTATEGDVEGVVAAITNLVGAKDPRLIREMLGTVEGSILGVQQAAEDAQTALSDMLGVGQYRGSVQAFQDEMALLIPDLDEQLAAALEGVDPSAHAAAVNQFVGNTSDFLHSGVTAAIDSGDIVTSGDLATFVNNIVAGIEGSDLSRQVKDQLIERFRASTAGLGPALDEVAATAAAAATKAFADVSIIEKAKGPTIDFAAPLITAATDPTMLTNIETTLKGSLGPPVEAGITGGVAAGSVGFSTATGPGSVVSLSILSAANAMGAQFQTDLQKAMTSATAGISVGDAKTKPTGDAGGVGSGLVDSVVSAIEDGASAITAAARSLGEDFADGIRRTAGQASNAGQELGGRFARGVASTARLAIVAARLTAVATVRAFEGMNNSAFNTGLSLASSFAQGIRAGVAAAVAAAITIAVAVINAARATLQAFSPSRVFVNIGRDVGKGFIEGIKEGEGEMASAISSAISDAIDAASDTAAAAAAEAGSAIFTAMFPATIPGGTTRLDVQQQQLAIRQQIAGIRPGLQGEAAGAVGDEVAASARNARAEIALLPSTFNEAILDIRHEVRDALAHRDDIDEWIKEEKRIEKERRAGTLGWKEHAKQLAELNLERRYGLITGDQYNDSVADLNKRLRAGILNQEAYNDAISELGERPAPLSFRELQAIRVGAQTLDSRTFIGAANAEAINEGLEAIQSYAQTALESGVAVDTVRDNVNLYVRTLRNQAVRVGLTATGFDSLATAMGLTTTQMNSWVTAMTSLNTTTAEGQTNIQTINEQLGAIREYGASLLEAGFSAATTRAELVKLRDQLIQQAVAFGFNRTQIQALVTAAGLADTQLADFITQMQNFALEARNAEQQAAAAAQAAADRAAAEQLAAQEAAAAARTPVGRPVVENLNVYVPYGDPEAVGMAAANRIAYNSLTSW